MFCRCQRNIFLSSKERFWQRSTNVLPMSTQNLSLPAAHVVRRRQCWGYFNRTFDVGRWLSFKCSDQFPVLYQATDWCLWENTVAISRIPIVVVRKLQQEYPPFCQRSEIREFSRSRFGLECRFKIYDVCVHCGHIQNFNGSDADYLFNRVI